MVAEDDAGDRVKALIAGWLALPLLWKIVVHRISIRSGIWCDLHLVE